MGPHHEHQPEVAISVRADGGADHETPGTRAHHQFVVARRAAGVAALHALLRVEGGDDHVDALPGARAGPEILVNSVAPGTIQFPGEPPDEEYIRRVPLHRTGTGDDIADAVAYLASAEFVRADNCGGWRKG